jgi:ATP-dependent DNA ligase
MLARPADTLPVGRPWTYEVKWDGYRAIAAKDGERVKLVSRNQMAKLRWVEPALVIEVEFVEWTRDGLLRHPRLVGIRDDKKAKDVIREDRVVRHA